MNQSMGSVFTYNFIILFLVLMVAFLMGTISYNKAFRVNSRIINAIEKYEGYNGAASKEIDRSLGVIGYRRKGEIKCPTKNNTNAMKNISGNFQYCIYEFPVGKDKKYYTYGVLTYIDFDLPIAGNVKLPIYSKTNQIYQFTSK